MKPKTEIITLGDPEAAPHTVIDAEDTGPKLGEWYWVKGKKENADDGDRSWLGCVTHVGSNYARLSGVDKSHQRIHFDIFEKKCRRAMDVDRFLTEKVASCRQETERLLIEVKELTERLAITPGLALPATQATALALRSNDQPVEEYKAALILAKKTTLPELFKAIERSNEEMATWMKAKLLPLKAQAGELEGSIGVIEDRIFNVELYAGLVEAVEQVREGEPAEMATPVHLMQRRCYMDEECLAQYRTGGMAFKNLGEFDAWLSEDNNLNRILPFPRCVVAFQVRRNEKHREITLSNFFSIIEEIKLDKLTFLYIRNGDQLFRLSTEITFGEKLFPDLDEQKLDRGKLWGKTYHGGSSVEKIITNDEYEALVAEEAAKQKKCDEAPDDEKWRYRNHWPESAGYTPFTPDNVYYDDIANSIAAKISKHNRLVLVLQGLLDRSPVLHPHPHWSLWSPGIFEKALKLIYDDSRTLTTGDKPDFEAYRERLNAQIREGSVTIGQDGFWARLEAKKAKEAGRGYSRDGYYPKEVRPYGNPGPGYIAKIASFSPRSKKATYTWNRKRQVASGDHEFGENIPTSCVVPVKHLFNVSAYKPGDFKLFFSDPRTRADYLKWAPFLLEAEEYHAGNREVQEPIPRKRRAPSTREGRARYAKMKRCRALVGGAVRLTRAVTMKNGHVFPKGTIFRVTYWGRGGFNLAEITADGARHPDGGGIHGLEDYYFSPDESVPPDPEREEEKPTPTPVEDEDEDDEDED